MGFNGHHSGNISCQGFIPCIYIYPFPLPPPLTLLLLPSPLSLLLALLPFSPLPSPSFSHSSPSPLSPLSPSRTPPLLPSPDRGTPSRGVWDNLTSSLSATVVGNPMGQSVPVTQDDYAILCVVPIATSCGASMREAPFMYIYIPVYTHMYIYCT